MICFVHGDCIILTFDNSVRGGELLGVIGGHADAVRLCSYRLGGVPRRARKRGCAGVGEGGGTSAVDTGRAHLTHAPPRTFFFSFLFTRVNRRNYEKNKYMTLVL